MRLLIKESKVVKPRRGLLLIASNEIRDIVKHATYATTKYLKYRYEIQTSECKIRNMNSFVNEGMLWYQCVVGRQTQQRQETECEINDYPLLRKMPLA